MMELIKVTGKIFTFALPKNKMIKDNTLFMQRVNNVMEENCINIISENCGEFKFCIDMEYCMWSENEIISIIDDIAKDIGFEKE